MKGILNKSLRYINRSMRDLRWENGRIFINDPNNTISPIENWVRKGNRVYITEPHLFGNLDESLPISINEISKIYDSVENKCILTARVASMREKIIKRLVELGLEMPKYGIIMRPDGRRGAGEWKGEMIVRLVKKYGANKVVFYDDNPKYIKKAKRIVNSELPYLDFVTIKV